MRWICSGLLIAQRPPCFGVTPDASAWCGTVVETSSLVNKAGTEISTRWYPPRPRVGGVELPLDARISASLKIFFRRVEHCGAVVRTAGRTHRHHRDRKGPSRASDHDEPHVGDPCSADRPGIPSCVGTAGSVTGPVPDPDATGARTPPARRGAGGRRGGSAAPGWPGPPTGR